MAPTGAGPSGATAPKTKSVSGSPRARSVSGSPRTSSAAQRGAARSAVQGGGDAGGGIATSSLFAPSSPGTATSAGAAPAGATSAGAKSVSRATGSGGGPMSSSPVLDPSPLPPPHAPSSLPSSPLPLMLSVLTIVALPALANLAALLSPHFLAPLLGLRMAPAGAGVTPPVCQVSHAPAIGGLPVLVFVAGVNGAGHEILSSFFHRLQDRTNLTLERYDPEVHLTADDGQIADSSQATSKTLERCPKLPYSRQVYDFGAEITSRLASLQDAPGVPFRGVYVRTGDTLPMGHVHTPLARPDLVALGMFHGVMYRLKVIVLVRAPSEIMKARVRNGSYGRDPGRLFRVTEDSLAYLDASVRQLPCGTYCALNVHTLLDPSDSRGQLAASSALAEFLDFSGVGPMEVLEVLSQSRGVLLKPGEGPNRGGGEGAKGVGQAGGGGGKGKGQRRMLAGKGGKGGAGEGKEGAEERSAGAIPGKGEEEEVKKWLKDMAEESSPRHLMWPFYSALASHPAFKPSHPGDWPGL